jgi:hypothetical protein
MFDIPWLFPRLFIFRHDVAIILHYGVREEVKKKGN